MNKGLLRFSSVVLSEGGLVLFLTLLPKLIILFIVLLIFLFRRVIVHIPEDLIRWILIYLTSFIVFGYTREDGGRRGLFSYLGHATIFLIGWLSAKWSGMLFLSLPLLLVYYIALYYFAQVIIPVANPEGTGLRYKDISSPPKIYCIIQTPDTYIET